MLLKRGLMSSIALPLINRLTSRQFWALHKQMGLFERASPADRRSQHEERLCAMLRHAGTSVPLWRDAFRVIDTNPRDLRPSDAILRLPELPVTNKSVYKQGYPHRTTSEEDRKTWRFLSSSGTVDRLTVVTDLLKRDYLAASLIRVNVQTTGRDVGVQNVEIPPQCCNVRCQLPEVKEGITDFLQFAWKSCRRGALRSPDTVARLRACLRQLVLPRNVLMPINPMPGDALVKVLDERIDQIRAAGPTIIRALPMYLLWLADRMLEQDISLPTLRTVLPWGGLVTPSMARRIQQGFGVPFHDVYGATELGEMAISCGNGNGSGLHVLEDLYEVEILDASGSPVAPGEKGLITVTDFTNRSMPMIRYQVGDVGYFPAKPCTCAKPGRRLVVCGRTAETVWTDEGEPIVTAYELLELFFRNDDIMNFRVDEISDGTYAATVVKRPNADVDSAALARDLQRLLRSEALPDIRWADFVRPEDSGKYRFLHPLKRRIMGGRQDKNASMHPASAPHVGS